MLESVANWIINVISSLGYPGILLTMAMESALVPLPSEIIMPFSGFLASTGRFDLSLVILMGALGNTLGSIACYGLGFWGHERIARRFVRNYGKYLLISEKELDETEKLMHRYKSLIVFGARVVPGIRTVVSLPAGVAKLPLGVFTLLTFIGSLLWSTLLTLIGYVLGNNWRELSKIFHVFEGLIAAVVIGGIFFYLYKKLRER